MLVESGEAFPEVAEWSMVYLRPIEGLGRYRLSENDHAAQHPDSMLHVLERVVDGNVLQGYETPFLRELLDAMAAANATEITGDPLFRRLYGITTQ